MHSLPKPDLMALGKTFDYWAGESRAVWRSGEGVCQCDAMKWGMSVLQGAVCAFHIVCSFGRCLLLIKLIGTAICVKTAARRRALVA
jgi:hypothetical protein